LKSFNEILNEHRKKQIEEGVYAEDVGGTVPEKSFDKVYSEYLAAQNPISEQQSAQSFFNDAQTVLDRFQYEYDNPKADTVKGYNKAFDSLQKDSESARKYIESLYGTENYDSTMSAFEKYNKAIADSKKLLNSDEGTKHINYLLSDEGKAAKKAATQQAAVDEYSKTVNTENSSGAKQVAEKYGMTEDELKKSYLDYSLSTAAGEVLNGKGSVKDVASKYNLAEKELSKAVDDTKLAGKYLNLENKYSDLSYKDMVALLKNPEYRGEDIYRSVNRYINNFGATSNPNDFRNGLTDEDVVVLKDPKGEAHEHAYKAVAEDFGMSEEDVKRVYNDYNSAQGYSSNLGYKSRQLSDDDKNYLNYKIIQNADADQLQSVQDSLPKNIQNEFSDLNAQINVVMPRKQEKKFYLDVSKAVPDAEKLYNEIVSLENKDVSPEEKPDNDAIIELKKEAFNDKLKEAMGDSQFNFDNYHKYRERYNEHQATVKQNEAWKEFNETPVGGAVGNVARPFINMFGSIADAARYGGAQIDKLFGGDGYIDPESTANYTAQIVTDVTSKKINEATRDNYALNYFANLGYSTATSMTDMALAAGVNMIPYVGTAASSAMFFSSAGVSKANEVLENGGTLEQATASMVAAGSAELLFERISLDKLESFQLHGDYDSARKYFKNLGKQAFVEGSEEFVTTLADTFADELINGDRSSFNLSKKKYMEQGLSESEATNKAMNDWGSDIIADALGGAISGGAMGAVQGGAQLHKVNKDSTELGGEAISSKDFDLNLLVEQGKKSNFPEAVKLANSIDKQIASYNNSQKADNSKGEEKNAKAKSLEETIGFKNIGRLMRLVQTDADMQRRSEEKAVSDNLDDSEKAIVSKIQKGSVLSKNDIQTIKESAYLTKAISTFTDTTADKVIKSVDFNESRPNKNNFKVSSKEGVTLVNNKEFNGGIEIESVDTRKGLITYNLNHANGKTEQLTSKNIKFASSTEALLHEQAASYNTEQARAFVDSYKEGQDVNKYAREWNLYSNYGRLATNLSPERMNLGGTLTNEQKITAYEMGLNSRVAANQLKTIIDSDNEIKPYTSQNQGSFVNNIPSGTKLTFEQNQMKNFLRDMSVVTGLNIEVFQSKTDKHGNFIGENGSFDSSTRTLRVDINAGLNNENEQKAYKYSVLNTAAHELTHVAKQGNKYDILREAIISALGTTDKKFSELVDKKFNELKSNGKYKNLTDKELTELADEEVVCDSCETMLQGNTKFFENLYNKDKSLAKKFIEAIKSLVKAIKSYITGSKHANTAYGKALLEVADDLYDQIQQLWNEAVESGLEAAQTQQDEKSAAQTQQKNSTTGESGVMYAKDDTDNKSSDRFTDTAYLSAVERGDMETAQRMVDEAARAAGYNTPVLYHGTKFYQGFTSFRNKANSEFAPRGVSIATWFSDKKAVVDGMYGDGTENAPIFKVYGRLKNSLVIDAKGNHWNNIKLPDDLKNKGVNRYYHPLRDMNIESDTASTEQIATYAHKNGYDSVVFKNLVDGSISKGINSDIYAVFGASQTKLADPVTYDNNGNVIPLSKRFNTENNDIRYQDRDYSVEPEDYDDLFDDLFTEDGDLSFGEETDTRRAESFIEKMIDFDAESAAYFLSYSANEIAQNTLNGLRDIELSDSSYLKIAKKLYNNSTSRMGINSETIAERVKGFVMLYDDGMYKSFDEFISSITEWNEQNLRSDRFASPENLLTNAYNLISYIAEEKASYVNKASEMSEKYAKMERASNKNKVEAKQLKAENKKLNRSLSYQEDLIDYYRRNNYNAQSEISKLQMLNKQLEKAKLKAEEQSRRRIERTIERYDKKLDKQKLKAGEQKAAALDRMRTRYEKLLDAEKAKSKDRRRADHDKTVERYEKKIAELKEKSKQQKKAIREDRDTKLIAEKEKRQADLKALRDNRDKKEYVRKIKKVASELQQWVLHPKDRHFVPQEFLRSGFYDAVNEITEALIISDNTKIADRLRTISAGIRKLQNEDEFRYDIDPVIADEMNQLAATIGGKKINRELTLRQAEDIYKSLKIIKDSIVNARKLIFENETKDVVEMGVAVIKEQKALKVVNFNKHLKKLKNLFLTPERMHNIITGYNDNSALNKVFQEIKRGIRKKNDFYMDANKMFDSYRNAHVKELDSSQHNVRAIKWTDSSGTEQTTKMTGMQAMQIVMTWNREAADERLNHLEKGGVSILEPKEFAKGNFQKAYDKRVTVLRLNESFIKSVSKSLTEFERGYIDIAEQFFNVMAKDAINEASLKLKHFETATSDYYIPIKVDEAEIVKEIEGVKFDSSIENMGMLKSIIPYSDKAVLIQGLDSVVNKHIENVGNYYGLAIPIRNMNKLLNVSNVERDADGKRLSSDSVRHAIESNWGKFGVDIYEQLLTDLQTSRAPKNEKFQDIKKITAKLRSNFVTATLNANPSVVLKQAASYSVAGVYLDQSSLAKGSADMLEFLKPGKYQALLDEIDSHTSQHYMRRAGLSSNEIAAIQESWIKTSKLGRNINNSKIMQKLPNGVNPTNWIQEMDCLTTAALWCATKAQVDKEYKQANKKFDTSEYWREVSDLYNKVIEDTQPMYDAMHRPEILKSSSELVKSIFMFKTQPLQNAGIIYDSVGRLIQNKNNKMARKQLRKALFSQGKSLLVFASMSMLIGALMHRMDRYKDEDDELSFGSIMNRFAKDVVQNGTGVIIPLGGSEAAAYITNLIDSNSYLNNDVVSDNIVDTVNKFASSGTNLVQTIGKEFGVDDKGNVNPDWNNIAKSAESFFITWSSDITGAPVKNSKNIIKGAIDWIKDIADGGGTFEPDVGDMKSNQIVHSYQKHFEKGETDIANERVQEFYNKKLSQAENKGSVSPEKEARNAVRDAFVDYYKKDYQKAFRNNDSAEIERIRKILTSQSKYMKWETKNTPLSEKLREWQKEAAEEKKAAVKK